MSALQLLLVYESASLSLLCVFNYYLPILGDADVMFAGYYNIFIGGLHFHSYRVCDSSCFSQCKYTLSIFAMQWFIAFYQACLWVVIISCLIGRLLKLQTVMISNVYLRYSKAISFHIFKIAQSPKTVPGFWRLVFPLWLHS